MMFNGMFNFFKLLKEKFRNKKEAKKYIVEEGISASPNKTKELATSKKESWVGVLDTHVNPDNIRNGFFELDWNEYFIVQLKASGYQGKTEEEIVDRWFQDLCRNIGAEEGIDMERRGAGFINVNNIGNGKSEIS